MSSPTKDEPAILRLVDMELEGHVIGACLTHPELLAGIDVTTDDFYSEANRRVWHALVSLAADGEHIDTLSLKARMSDLGTLEAAGGFDYLLGLTDAGWILKPPLPTARLRRLASERRLQTAMLAAVARIGTPEAGRDLARVQREIDTLAAIERGGARVIDPPSLAARFEALSFDGRRLRTGIDTLDTATRGGVPMGSFLVLAGAPGAAKTTFSVWLGDQWERQGAQVLYLASDESMASVLVRIGQLEGVSRDALESPMPTARKALSVRLTKTPRALNVIDPADEGVTLEDAGRYLDAIAGDRMRVLVVDSLQTVPCSAAAEELTDYGRSNAVVAECKRIARRGTIVVAISEMSRSGYREQGADTSTLSSAKGTGAIEYGAALVLGMRPVRDKPGAIDLDTAKNRLGNEKPSCRVQIDFERASFGEIDAPDREAEKRAGFSAREAKDRAQVLMAVRKNPHLNNKNNVCAAAGIAKQRGLAAIAALIASGEMLFAGGFYSATEPANTNNFRGL